MATNKRSQKKSAPKKTIITKIAGQVGQWAGGLTAGKEHLVEIVTEAIESAKSALADIKAKKKAPPKKSGKAKAKKAVTKASTPAIKKTNKPAAAKKAAPLKKAIKKVKK